MDRFPAFCYEIAVSKDLLHTPLLVCLTLDLCYKGGSQTLQRDFLSQRAIDKPLSVLFELVTQNSNSYRNFL